MVREAVVGACCDEPGRVRGGAGRLSGRRRSARRAGAHRRAASAGGRILPDAALARRWVRRLSARRALGRSGSDSRHAHVAAYTVLHRAAQEGRHRTAHERRQRHRSQPLEGVRRGHHRQPVGDGAPRQFRCAQGLVLGQLHPADSAPDAAALHATWRLGAGSLRGQRDDADRMSAAGTQRHRHRVEPGGRGARARDRGRCGKSVTRP